MKRLFRTIPPSTLLALSFLIVLTLLALSANFISPYDFRKTDLLARLDPPVFAGGSWAHILGTDELGRDVLSRILYGLQTSLLIALFGTMIGAIVGTLLGFLAAHFRGPVEQVIMAAVDFQAAVPFIILVLFFMALAGSGLWIFLLLVGLAGWEVYARLTRGLVLSAREQNYVLALQGLQLPQSQIYARHILPNIASGLIVQLTLNFPSTMLLETGLSFLGLGVQPPNTSLGLMLGTGRNHLLNAWWIAVCPGTVIFMTTLLMSMVGDWLRDQIDPLSQGR